MDRHCHLLPIFYRLFCSRFHAATTKQPIENTRGDYKTTDRK